MVDIRNEVVVRKPRQEVFDRLSDPRSELQWNPKAEVMEALDGALQVESRFRAKWKLSKPLTLTITRFDRPNGWSYTNDGPIVVQLDVDLEDHPDGTLLRTSFKPTPRGAGWLMFPIFLLIIRREEKANMRLLKAWLEGLGGEPDGGAAGAAADGVDWDARYAGSEQVWSGNPNSTLVAEVSELTAGTAVDVGCGEGADAIWLAQRGWQVTAFDVSSTALRRAADHIANAGVTVHLVHRGLLDPALPGAQFDLVNVQYPALLHEQGRSLATLLDLVAPGGTLLFVHHADVETDRARRAGFNPADYVLPRDVHAAVDEDWDVQVFEERPRHVTTGAGAAHNRDLVLKALRKPAPVVAG